MIVEDKTEKVEKAPETTSAGGGGWFFNWGGSKTETVQKDVKTN